MGLSLARTKNTTPRACQNMIRLLSLAFPVLLGLSACGESNDAPNPTTSETPSAQAGTAGDTAPENTASAAAAAANAEADGAAPGEAMTPDDAPAGADAGTGDAGAPAEADAATTRQAATPETAPSGGEAWAALDEVIAADNRPAEDTGRDQWRHPRETLEFFGIGPSGAIAEIWPGGGYYARTLAPWIAEEGGTYYAIHPAAMRSQEGEEYRETFEAAFAGPVFGEIHHGGLSAESESLVGETGVLDAVLTFRNVHNWMGRGFEQKAFNDFYAALKPGGVLGVVEHRAPEGGAPDILGSDGYVPTSYVKTLAGEAGFEFVAESEINANPEDDAAHPMGVWTLKPTRRSPEPGTPEAEDFDRAEYDAIGESDRMTLLFRKPEA